MCIKIEVKKPFMSIKLSTCLNIYWSQFFRQWTEKAMQNYCG